MRVREAGVAMRPIQIITYRRFGSGLPGLGRTTTDSPPIQHTFILEQASEEEVADYQRHPPWQRARQVDDNPSDT